MDSEMSEAYTDAPRMARGMVSDPVPQPEAGNPGCQPADRTEDSLELDLPQSATVLPSRLPSSSIH